MLLLAAGALLQGQPETRREQRSLGREVPPAAGPGGAPAGTAGDASAAPPRTEAVTSAPGRLVLDLSEAFVTLVPGPPGQPLRVEADFDAGRYDLSEEFRPAAETGWEYSVRLTPRRSVWGRFIVVDSDAERTNRIRVTVPRGVPLTLSGRISLSESDIDLGGLALSDIELSLGVGRHHVRFAEPLAAPAERLSIQGSIGDISVVSLGNASPRQTLISHRIGSTHVDLGGEWRRDSRVEVDFGIGDCSLWGPRNARLEIESAAVTLGDARLDALRSVVAPAGAPVVRLSISGTIGGVKALP